MKSLQLFTLVFMTLLFSCTKDPIETKEIEIPSTFVYENLTTDIKYYNIDSSDLSLSETNEALFFEDDTTSQNNFNEVVLLMQGLNTDSSNPHGYIKSVEFVNDQNIELKILEIHGSDTLEHSINCVYNKDSQRIYSTESCSTNELGKFTFYFDNNILNFYSQVILMIKTGTGFQTSSMEARLTSTEDLNAALQNYIDENPPGQTESKIAIAHIKRNYRKI